MGRMSLFGGCKSCALERASMDERKFVSLENKETGGLVF